MKKQIFNPYLPNYEYIPDGEPRVFEGRLYVYGSHDSFGSPFFCENDYVLWSAPVEDLSTWTYHGVIFRKDQDPLNRELLSVLFAPDAIQGIDGRYYLYYAPCEIGAIGVAVADRPEGPFEFLNHVGNERGLLGKRDDDPYPFDPAIFVEDDKVYLYVGFDPDPSWDFIDREFGGLKKPGAYVTELKQDMYTIRTEPVKLTINNVTDHGHDFFEASSIRKIKDKYYFIYSSWNSHELCYAMSNNPKGPFEYKGILHDNGDIGIVDEKHRVTYTGNNHGSIEEINGKYYIFGHRQTNYSTFARQGIAERIYLKQDGTFDQAELTSCGLNDGPLVSQGKYNAAIACHLTSKDGALHYMDNCEGEGFENIRQLHPAFTQDSKDEERIETQYIRNMRDGSTAGFKYFTYKDEVKLQVTSRGDEGLFEVRTDLNGAVLATIPLSENKDYKNSEPVIIRFPNKEKLSLYFTYRGKGSIDFLSFEFV